MNTLEARTEEGLQILEMLGSDLTEELRKEFEEARESIKEDTVDKLKKELNILKAK